MMLQLQNGKFYITMGVTVGWAEAIKHIRSLQPFTLDAFGTQLDAVEERVAYSHESFVSNARPVTLHFHWFAFLARMYIPNDFAAHCFPSLFLSPAPNRISNDAAAARAGISCVSTAAADTHTHQSKRTREKRYLQLSPSATMWQRGYCGIK